MPAPSATFASVPSTTGDKRRVIQRRKGAFVAGYMSRAHVSTRTPSACRCALSEGAPHTSNPIPPSPAPTPSPPPRRAFLQTASLASLAFALTLPTPPAATALTDDFETYTSPSLHVRLQYPRTWFRSERNGSLVLVNLSDVIAATISRKSVLAAHADDAFAAAYDLVRDRIEKEGAEIFVKEASWEGGVVAFRFESEMAMPNGDVVQRVGVGKGLEDVACIVTAPKERWEKLGEVAERVVQSLVMV